MICCPYGEFGAPVAEPYRQARYKIRSLRFSDDEKEIRSHLAGMLSGAVSPPASGANPSAG